MTLHLSNYSSLSSEHEKFDYFILVAEKSRLS